MIILLWGGWNYPPHYECWCYGTSPNHPSQQAGHSSALMIARDGFMQLVPQPFDVINPRTVNWLEYQAKLGVLLQPSIGLLAFVNDVVIEDKRDGFGSSVVATQLFQHSDKQG